MYVQIKQTFNTDFADLHSEWKHNHYDWLPGLSEIPKQLGEQLDQEYLDKLEVRAVRTQNAFIITLEESFVCNFLFLKKKCAAIRLKSFNFESI